MPLPPPPSPPPSASPATSPAHSLSATSGWPPGAVAIAVAAGVEAAAGARWPPWHLLALATLFCLLIAVTLVGNTLVIVAVLTCRRLRTVTNCYVVSLAVADWLVGACVMPLKVMRLLMGRWALGGAACAAWLALDVLLCSASILSLCAIAVDRCLAVTRPLRYSRRHRSKRLALLMVAAAWLCAALLTCPPFLFLQEAWVRREDRECTYVSDKGYVVFSALGSFFLPLAVMLYVYARIACVVAHRPSHLAASLQTTSLFIKGLEDSELERESSVYAQTRQSERRNSRATRVSSAPAAAEAEIRPRARLSAGRPRDTKTAQTLTAVVGGFVACWLPFFVCYLVAPFVRPIDQRLMDSLVWLGWINSALNPFIYAFYNPDFRIAFWRLTFRLCSSPRRPEVP